MSRLKSSRSSKTICPRMNKHIPLTYNSCIELFIEPRDINLIP